MIQVKIYYNIRRLDENQVEVKLFSEKRFAELDQTLPFSDYKWDESSVSFFVLSVEKNTVYIDEVMTKEDYIKHLKEKLATSQNSQLKQKIKEVLSKLRR